ncbi:Heat stress transcription factor A-4b [Forsythia ovata]|uniref:Heat stress transcription factor A-4b n=1 Tax=Forsythia ovata TaxID=205694 RepID=A0ABD1SB49_9LAMI
MPVSSGESDLICQTCSPECRISSSPSRDLPSSPELAARSTHVDSPAISSICIDLDSRPKPSGIDVNMSPANAHDIDMSKDLKQDGTLPSVSAGANDVFWQQFLMEGPGSSETQEVQSERRELDDRHDPSMSLDARRTWWNVEKLTPQMEHFA